jgi:hypothetical protein
MENTRNYKKTLETIRIKGNKLLEKLNLPNKFQDTTVPPSHQTNSPSSSSSPPHPTVIDSNYVNVIETSPSHCINPLKFLLRVDKVLKLDTARAQSGE